MRRGFIVTTLTAVAAILIAMPAFADALLSGTIKSSDGKAMGGITVSAKPDSGTITTTVFTDAAGQYYFPALPAGHYRVWAQALSYQTAKGAVDLANNAKQDFTLAAMSDPEATFKQLPGNLMLDALPQRTPAEGRMKRIVRTVCTGCHTASFPLQHRFDEAGWSAVIELMKNANVYGTFVGGERKPSGHSRLSSEGACELSRAGARPRRKRHARQAPAAAVGRSGTRHVQGIRRPARSRFQPAGRLRAERRQRLVAGHALGADPRLGHPRFLARSVRQSLVHLQHPQQAHDHRPHRYRDRRGQAVQGGRAERACRANPRHDARSQRHHLVQHQQWPRRHRPARSGDARRSKSICRRMA